MCMYITQDAYRVTFSLGRLTIDPGNLLLDLKMWVDDY